MKTIFSIDVEPDLHDDGNRGINEGLVEFEKLCDKYKIKPVLFVVGALIIKHKNLFKRLDKKGWEISCHGYSHARLDDMTDKAKEIEIKKLVEIWGGNLGFKPNGFRAPQHSIDKKTLELLDENEFEYDSSYSPLNLLQLLFFPSRVRSWLKLFFSRLNKYKIKDRLEEKPVSGLGIPFVSLTVRILPKWLLWVYVKLLRLFYNKPMFYAHSWDFIDLPKSRIDRMFGHKRFIKNLDYVMSLR